MPAVRSKKIAPKVSELPLAQYLRWLATTLDKPTAAEVLRRAKHVDAIVQCSWSLLSQSPAAPGTELRRCADELREAIAEVRKTESALASSKGGKA